MKVKKAIKKIVALGVGATMLGATLFGAAAQLEDFPGQYIDTDGEFDGLFVVGEEAAAADIIGVNSITAAVQSRALKRTFVELPASEASFEAEDGEFLVTGSSQLFAIDTETAEKMTDDEFSALLADGMVEDDNDEDEEYDYKQEITFETLETIFAVPSDEDRTGGDPAVLLDVDGKAVMTYTVEFTGTDLFVEGLEDGEEIEMLGHTYTFKDGSDENEITLYESSETHVIARGEQIEYGDHVIEVVSISGESDPKYAYVKVDGVSELINEGEQETVNGLEIKLDQAVIDTHNPDLSFAKLFIGADEVVLEDGQEVEVNGDEVDGVVVNIASTGDNVESIQFVFTPTDFVEEIEEMLPGESFVDPLFGLTFQFVEASATSYDDSELISNDDDVEFTFTNVDGEDVTLNILEVDGDDSSATVERYIDSSYGIRAEVFEGNAATDLTAVQSPGDTFYFDDVKYKIESIDGSSNVNITNVNEGTSDIYVADDTVATGLVVDAVVASTSVTFDDGSAGAVSADQIFADVVDEDVFILAEDTDEDEVTSFYKVNGVKEDGTDSYVKIENLNSGEEKEFKEGRELWDTGVYVGQFTDDGSDDKVDLIGAAVQYVRTEGQLKYDFSAALGATTFTIDVEEISTADKFEDVTPATATIEIDANSDGELEFVFAQTSGELVGDDDNDFDHWRTQFGTKGVIDIDNDQSVEISVPNRAVEYNVLFGVDTEASQEEGANGYYVTEVVSIPASASVLDTEVTNPMSENLIVVGGPCANSVASTLMGSPADCTADFTPGTALIKMFDETDGMASGKVALLVAGYDAEDTRAASAIVSELGDDLEGDEVVLTTSTSTVTETESVDDEADEPADDEADLTA